MTPDEQLTLVVLAAGPTAPDRVASYLGLPEHEATAVIESLIRRSLVARLQDDGSRPGYEVTVRGMAAAERITGGFAPEESLAFQIAMVRPWRVRRPRRRAKKRADDQRDYEVRRKLLATLLGGPRTREQLAQELRLSEQATGQLLDKLSGSP